MCVIVDDVVQMQNKFEMNMTMFLKATLSTTLHSASILTPPAMEDETPIIPSPSDFDLSLFPVVATSRLPVRVHRREDKNGADRGRAHPSVDFSRADALFLSRKAVASAKIDPSGRVYRVYCQGVFDVFDTGHMKSLERVKKALGADRTRLIVGVYGDIEVEQQQGKTVIDHANRCDSCRHCRWVDEVASDAHWQLSESFLSQYSIDFVVLLLSDDPNDHRSANHLSSMDTMETKTDIHILQILKDRAMLLEVRGVASPRDPRALLDRKRSDDHARSWGSILHTDTWVNVRPGAVKDRVICSVGFQIRCVVFCLLCFRRSTYV